MVNENVLEETLSEANNVDSKTEPEAVKKGQISDLEKNIIRQVEYYFGDRNLPHDKFLQEKIKCDDGWITITVLLTFKRLSKMTTSPDVIVDALLKSTNNLLEISEDRSKIRRSPSKPLPEMNEELRKEILSRTVYAKGFPLDMELDSALDFFKNYDSIENVEMRSYFDRKTKKSGFKGSVFVTFEKQAFAQKFMALEKVTYHDRQLIRLWQSDYFEMKRRETKGKYSPSDEEKLIHRPPNGTVICVEGLSEETTREDIREAFLDLTAEIAFIEYCEIDRTSKVRLRNAENAKEILSKIVDGKIKICEVEAPVHLLEGEEERKYLDKVVENIRNYCLKQGQMKRGGRTGRGRMDDRKRKVATENGATPPKQQSPEIVQRA